MVAQAVKVIITAAVPGHAPVRIVNLYCEDEAAAQQWQAWKVRHLEDEGFDVLTAEISGG